MGPKCDGSQMQTDGVPPSVSLFKGTEILRVNVHATSVYFRDGASWETGRYYFGVRTENGTCQAEGQNTGAII